MVYFLAATTETLQDSPKDFNSERINYFFSKGSRSLGKPRFFSDASYMSNTKRTLPVPSFNIKNKMLWIHKNTNGHFHGRSNTYSHFNCNYKCTNLRVDVKIDHEINTFSDHFQTIHGFRDSVPVRKFRACC